ncbi:CCL4 protein, partial [Crocuta crocuta]
PTACCFSYISWKVPLHFVKDYYRTYDQCPSPGIVLHTRKGRQVCTNPNDAWVQEYIRYLDNSK